MKSPVAFTSELFNAGFNFPPRHLWSNLVETLPLAALEPTVAEQMSGRKSTRIVLSLAALDSPGFYLSFDESDAKVVLFHLKMNSYHDYRLVEKFKKKYFRAG